MQRLATRNLGKIWPVPVEVEDPTLSRIARIYDAEYANRFWRILVRADKVFESLFAASLANAALCIFYWGSLIWR